MMTPEAAKGGGRAPADFREEIKAAIAYYEEHGKCWLSVVTFIGIKALFGGWFELTNDLRGGTRIYRKRLSA